MFVLSDCLRPPSIRLRRRFFAGYYSPLGTLVVVGGLGLGGCAQRPQDVTVSHGREYFPSSIYGPASKRVVAEGQPVPHGGGQYLVGKPYTIAGRTYYPSESQKSQVGHASWYGDAFHGRLTANGEVYDRDSFTAASPTMPLPSYARVTNLRNNYSMIVRVNDRGPYASDRIMDVSRRVAEALDYKRYGTTLLKVEYVGRASLAGSDDARLYATLRTERPATWQSGRTMLAEASSRAQVASNSLYASDALPARRSRIEVDEAQSVRSPWNNSDPKIAAFPVKRPRVAVVERSSISRQDRASRYEDRGEGASVRHRNVESYAEREGRTDNKYFADQKIAAAAWSHNGDRLIAVRHDRFEPSARSLASAKVATMPPSRPMDLGTIPGADSQIHARRDLSRLRIARSRDD